MVEHRRVTAAAALIAAISGAPLQASGPDQLVETYRDWVVRCVQTQLEDGTPTGRVCEMTQELSQSESGQRVLAAGVQAAKDGSAALTIVAPFGLLLADGIRLDLGSGDGVQIPFRTCLPQGCIAVAPLGDDTITELSAASGMTVRMTSESGQEVAVQMSLLGFTAGWARLLDLRAE